MGGGNSTIEYAIPINEKPKGETQVFRGPMFKDGLIDGPPGIKDIKNALLTSVAKHGKNNALGTIIKKQGEPDTVKFITYDELLEEAVSLGSGIIHENLAFQPEGEDLRFVGLFSRNRK